LRTFILSVILFGTFLGLVGCTPPQEPEEQVQEAQVAEIQEVTYTLNMLLSYHKRTYYLQPDDTLLTVANMIAEHTRYDESVAAEALIQLNPGNIAYNSNGLANFANNTVLDPIWIPEAPGIPSNRELGIQNPQEIPMFHKVQSGDTLYALAQQYGFITYQEFAAKTGITNPDTFILQPDQVLHWTIQEPAKLIESSTN